MSSILQVWVATGRPDSYLTQNFQVSGGGFVSGQHQIANRIMNYINSTHSGSEKAYGDIEVVGGPINLAPSLIVSVLADIPKASGTLTFASVVATNSFVINGVTFTAVASGASGNQFNVGLTDAATAINAAAAVNASNTTLIQGYVSASADTGVVTITAYDPGQAGNCITLAGGTHITASGARLTGGSEDPNKTIFTF